MSDAPATRKDIDDVLQVLQGFIQQTSERFDGVDRQLIQLNSRLGAVEHEIVDLKASHDRLLGTIDAFVGRLDHCEIEQAARDS